MNLHPLSLLGGVGCAGLVCLFLMSAVLLVLVLKRRARKDGTGDSGDVA